MSKTKKELLEKKRALLMVPEATTVESIQKAEESKVQDLQHVVIQNFIA